MTTDPTGFLSLVPALAVLGLALWTRKTFEALLGGTLVGYVLTSGWGFGGAFVGSMLSVMQDDTIGWIILVVGLFGSLVELLVRSGGTVAFGNKLSSLVKGPRGALLATWLMGLVIFLDDYLSALAVGASMRRVADRFGISREKLAYVVDSTAAPICVLVPLSTWAFYVAGLLEGLGLAETGRGLALYASVVPYMLYAWVAVLLVPLVALGIVPDLGPMRRARPVAAPPEETIQSGRLVDFLLPLGVLIGVAWFTRDALVGVMVAVALTTALLVGRRVLSFSELSDGFFDGFKSMVYPLAIVVMSFALRNVNEDLGLTQYVIETVRPIMSGALLPAVAFVSLSAIAFATGSFWGVYAVSLPIIVPLASAMDVHMGLALGAVISAGAFGSHACFYGDATVLAASSSGCDVFAHAITQLPYVLISASIATLLFAGLGFVL